MIPLLPYKDEVVLCPTCCGFGTISEFNWQYLNTTTYIAECPQCEGRCYLFKGEVLLDDLRVLAAHG